MKRTNVRIVGSIILAIATIAAVIFIIVPSFRAFQNPSELVAVEANNNTLTAKVKALQQTQAQYPQLKKIADQLTKQFPAAADVPTVTSIVANAASDAGLSSSAVTTLTFSNPVVAAATAGSAAASGTASATPAPAATPAAGATGSAGTGAAANTSSGSYATQAIQIVLTGGSESRYATFMRSLTNSTQNGRVFIINNFSTSSSAVGGGKTLTVNITAYLHEAVPALQTGGAVNTVPTPGATAPAAG